MIYYVLIVTQNYILPILHLHNLRSHGSAATPPPLQGGYRRFESAATTPAELDGFAKHDTIKK